MHDAAAPARRPRPASPPRQQATGEAPLAGISLAWLAYAASVAVLMLNMAPAVEPELLQVGRLSPGQVGAVFFVELAAMGLASFPAQRWVGRVEPAHAARWAFAVFVLGNGLSTVCLGSFAPYAAARGVAGFGAGSLMVLAMTLAARTHQPDRAYACITFAQLASGGLMLWAFSARARHEHLLGDLFVAAMVFGGLGLALTARRRRPGDRLAAPPPGAGPAPPALPWRTTGLAVAFALAFNLVVGGLWPFAAEYAVAGTPPGQLTRVFAGATGAGLAGAGAAWAIGRTWPHRRLLVTGHLGLLLGAGLLHFVRGPAGFAAGCCVLSLAWNFCVPYVFAAIAGQDSSGRLMSAANLAFAFGLATGPLLAGAVIGSLGLDGLFPCAVAGLALAAALALRITRAASA